MGKSDEYGRRRFFRYSGADPDDFFIDVECNTGSGGTPIAPSILTSAGSGVVRVATSGGFSNQQFVNSEQVNEGAFGFGASADGEFITGRGASFAFEDFGPTGVFEFDPTTGDWRACTIAFGPELNRHHTHALRWGIPDIRGALRYSCGMGFKKACGKGLIFAHRPLPIIRNGGLIDQIRDYHGSFGASQRQIKDEYRI